MKQPIDYELETIKEDLEFFKEKAKFWNEQYTQATFYFNVSMGINMAIAILYLLNQI